MSKSFQRSIDLLLRPGLVNLVSVHKLHDNFKCKILVDENSSNNKQVTEIQNDNPSSHRQRWIRHYDRIYDNLSSIDTTNYDGNYEFDENFTHVIKQKYFFLKVYNLFQILQSQDFQRKLLKLLNEEIKIYEDESFDDTSEYESSCSSEDSLDKSSNSSKNSLDKSSNSSEDSSDKSSNSSEESSDVLNRTLSANNSYLSFAVSINGKMVLKKGNTKNNFI